MAWTVPVRAPREAGDEARQIAGRPVLQGHEERAATLLGEDAAGGVPLRCQELRVSQYPPSAPADGAVASRRAPTPMTSEEEWRLRSRCTVSSLRPTESFDGVLALNRTVGCHRTDANRKKLLGFVKLLTECNRPA